MGHYASEMDGDDDRREKELCDMYRQWIITNLHEIENSKELEMIHDIVFKSKDALAGVRLLSKLLKIVK